MLMKGWPASDSLTQHHSFIISFRSVCCKNVCYFPLQASFSLFGGAIKHGEKESRMHVVAVKDCLPAIYFCTDPICEQAPATRFFIPLEIQFCLTLEGCLVKHCLFSALESIVWGVRCNARYRDNSKGQWTEKKTAQGWGYVPTNLKCKHSSVMFLICIWLNI